MLWNGRSISHGIGGRNGVEYPTIRGDSLMGIYLAKRCETTPIVIDEAVFKQLRYAVPDPGK